MKYQHLNHIYGINRNLKKYKTDNGDRGDAQRDFISNRKKPELAKRIFERKEPEIRNRVSVNKYAGQNKNRTVR